MPHEVVCITDYPSHLFGSHIRTVPLWEDLRELGGCYVRLKAFAPEMRDLIGPRFVWIDLDMVVTGDLTPLFDHREPVKLWRSDSLQGQPYNGSMAQMDAGGAAQVWQRFNVNRTPIAARAMGYRGSDQAIIAAILGPDVPVWMMDDGVYHLNQCSPKAVPPQARIVFSPGAPKVTDPNVQRRYPWLADYLRPQHPPAEPERAGKPRYVRMRRS